MPPFDPSAYSFDSIAVNVLTVWAIQKLKLTGRVQWISEATPRVTQFVSVAAAAVTAAGMSITWDMSTGTGTLTIAGITVGSVATFLWLTAKNLGFQHVIYQIAFRAPVQEGTPYQLEKSVEGVAIKPPPKEPDV